MHETAHVSPAIVDGNPDIRVVFIGKSALRMITIYPISLNDQLEMSKIISEALKKFAIFNECKTVLGLSSGSDDNRIGFIAAMLVLLKDHLGTFLGFVVDKAEYSGAVNTLLDDITNNQAVEIAEVIWQQNWQQPHARIMELFLHDGDNGAAGVISRPKLAIPFPPAGRSAGKRGHGGH